MNADAEMLLSQNEARATAYLLFSALLTSPGERRLVVNGPGIAGAVQAIADCLPGHAWRHDDMSLAFHTLDDAGATAFDQAYGGLFEVAESACTIREEHAEVAGKQKEEVVRYYDHFGYRPVDAVAWQPDHLAVELEFLYFLVEGEMRATSDDAGDSYRLAQLDFCQRHPGKWVPGMAARAQEAGAPASLVALLESLESFLNADLAWRRAHLPTRTH